MKFLSSVLAASLSVVSLNALAAQVQSFVEDNDLWMEDNVNFAPNITQDQFNKVIDAGLAAYKPYADERHEGLTVNRNWDDSTVNANCSRAFGVTVNMYGGLARREETTPDGFALVLCHELNHAYGGTPYISSWRKMSAEGQADYMGAKVCLDKVFEMLPMDRAAITTTPFMEKSCSNFPADSKENFFCLRKLAAGQSLGHLLSVLKKEALPNYETPDSTVVSQTLTSYPDTVQCRLDTYFKGAMNLDRPACWFKN